MQIRVIFRGANPTFLNLFGHFEIDMLDSLAIALPMEFLMDIDTIKLRFPYYINLMMHFLLWLGTSVSGLSLVLLNVDKLIFFKFPLR